MFFFFFKQKTAYEMRISDWSSDVCSSDLNGMTPASEVPDETFCFYQGSILGEKCFRNFDGKGGGIHTMRWGLEQSRNLMTVHIAMEAGMPKVRSEEHTSELQSLMRISYAVFCLKKKKPKKIL